MYASPDASERQGTASPVTFGWLGAELSESRFCLVLGWVLSSESGVQQVLLILLVTDVFAPDIESKDSEGAGEPTCEELKHALDREHGCLVFFSKYDCNGLKQSA